MSVFTKNFIFKISAQSNTLYGLRMCDNLTVRQEETLNDNRRFLKNECTSTCIRISFYLFFVFQLICIVSSNKSITNKAKVGDKREKTAHFLIHVSFKYSDRQQNACMTKTHVLWIFLHKFHSNVFFLSLNFQDSVQN